MIRRFERTIASSNESTCTGLGPHRRRSVRIMLTGAMKTMLRSSICVEECEIMRHSPILLCRVSHFHQFFTEIRNQCPRPAPAARRRVESPALHALGCAHRDGLIFTSMPESNKSGFSLEFPTMFHNHTNRWRINPKVSIRGVPKGKTPQDTRGSSQN